MKLSTLFVSAAVAAVALVFSLTSAGAVEPVQDANTIHVVEHPGYFETRSGIYNIDAGTYTFVVDNRSGKDAGFVLTREGKDPVIIGIANGETGRVEVELESGSYDYFCPIIPTAHYSITVK